MRNKRNRRRRIRSNMSVSIEQKKGVYNIADNNKDAFLGRSMGRKTKFNPKNVEEQVNLAL